MAHQQVVAVGFGFRDQVGGDDAGGPGLVFHDHRLAEPFLQLLRDDAPEHVGEAAGREADDDADRPVRVGIALGVRGRQDRRGEQKGEAAQQVAHDLLLSGDGPGRVLAAAAAGNRIGQYLSAGCDRG